VGLTGESPQVKRRSLHNPLIKSRCEDFTHWTIREVDSRTCMWGEGPQHDTGPIRRRGDEKASQPRASAGWAKARGDQRRARGDARRRGNFITTRYADSISRGSDGQKSHA
jgi:hypothetical protein